MIRFENVSDEIILLANEIQEKWFPELIDVKIKYLFDLKKRTSGDKIILGRCQKTDDLVKYFSVEEARDAEGYQYIITIDKVACDNIEKYDKIRILRHELRHILVWEKEDKTIYKIHPHDIEDFVEEIELNREDPRWSLRIGALISDIYEQQEEIEKEK